MFDQLAQKANRVPAGMTLVPEEFGERPMSAEEFKQAVTDYLLESNRRVAASRKPDPSVTYTSINAAPGWDAYLKASEARSIAYERALEEAAASGNLDIRRSREVEGHVYTMTRYVQVMEGRVVGGGMTMISGVDDATRAAMAKGKHVSGGWLDNGIGSFFLTFDEPAYLKEAEEALAKASATYQASWDAMQAATLK